MTASSKSMSDYNPEKAFIFRIAHIDCVPWILRHGIQCRSSKLQDPKFVNIGSESLIAKRATFKVPIAPHGTLSDYVPFYFTPFSIMMYNIHTGHGGIRQRTNDEIVIFVSSLHKLAKQGIPFLFTDQHAYAAGTEYYDNLEQLKQVDWPLLQSRNFRTDDADPGKQLRYQAEALVHQMVPVDALMGVACHSEETRNVLAGLVAQAGVTLDVKALPNWYFR